MSGQVICPQCGTTVDSHWEWCHACGFDPEGNRPAEPPPAPSFAGEAPPSFGVGGPGSSSLEASDYSPSATPGSHPYDDLPYTAPDSPSERRPGAGQSARFGASGSSRPPRPSGQSLMPTGPASDTSFGPPPDARPASAPVAPYTGSPPPGGGFAGGPAGSSPPGGGFAGSPPPGFGGMTPIGASGFVPAPAKSGSGRTALFVMIAILTFGVVGVGVVKMSGSDLTSAGPRPTTSRDPNAPPPLGAVVGNAPSTLAGPGAPVGPGVPTTIPAPTDGWVTYRAPDGTFQVEFPARPKTESDFIAAPGQQLALLDVHYDVGVDGGGYNVFFFDLPSAATYADSRAAYELINENNKKRGRTVLVDAGDITVDGIAGVRFTGERHGRPEQGAVVVKGKRIYEIEVLDVDEVSFNRFLASFHILRDPVK